jgi:hypothetical protein
MDGAPMITEQQARTAPAFIVDWSEGDHPDPLRNIKRLETNSYRIGCRLARKVAKRIGTSYLIPVIDGKEAAQWIYSDRYPRHFDA